MIVVSDTSPLNYLVLIDLHDILPALFEVGSNSQFLIANSEFQRFFLRSIPAYKLAT